MAQYRKDLLTNNSYYHIYNRSIAKYIIFNNNQEYSRILGLIKILCFKDFNIQYSDFTRASLKTKNHIQKTLKEKSEKFVEIIAYCIMPTHFHLILKQNIDSGITKYIGKLLNSYSKFFNTIHKRSGPLWSGRFKNKKIENDEQLLHLTRYIHLNPTSAKLIDKPEDWNYSSYKEYLEKSKNKICNFNDVIKLNSGEYKKFVNSRKNIQQEISIIKNLLIENHSG